MNTHMQWHEISTEELMGAKYLTAYSPVISFFMVCACTWISIKRDVAGVAKDAEMKPTVQGSTPDQGHVVST